jgi:hypothetical protein
MNTGIDYSRELDQITRVIERLILFADELPLFMGLFPEESSGTETAASGSQKEILVALIGKARQQLHFFPAAGLPETGDDSDEPLPLATLPVGELISQWIRYHKKLCHRLTMLNASLYEAEYEWENEMLPLIIREVMARTRQYLREVEYLLRQLFS